jgi:hypothetical protein
MKSLSNFPLIWSCFSMSWFFCPASKRGKREQWNGVPELQIPGSYFSWRGEGFAIMGGGAATWPPGSLSIPLWSEVADHWSEHRSQPSEDRVLFCPLWLPLAVYRLHGLPTTGLLVGRVSGMGRWYCAKSWSLWTFTTTCYTSFPLEVTSLQHTPEFRNSYFQ